MQSNNETRWWSQVASLILMYAVPSAKEIGVKEQMQRPSRHDEKWLLVALPSTTKVGCNFAATALASGGMLSRNLFISSCHMSFDSADPGNICFATFAIYPVYKY